MKAPTDPASKLQLVLSLTRTRRVVYQSADGRGPALLSPDGSVLVTGHASTHHGWDSTNGTLSRPFSAVVTTLCTGNEIPIHDYRLEERCAGDVVLDFTRDGETLLFLARDGSHLRLRNIECNNWRTPLNLASNRSACREMLDEAAKTPFVAAGVQSPDGRQVLLESGITAAVQSPDIRRAVYVIGTTIVQINKTDQLGNAFETPLFATRWCQFLKSAAFSPDGKFVVTGYQSDDAEDWGAVRVWSCKTGECLGVVNTPARPTKIGCDGTLLDQSGSDLGIRLDSKPGPAWVTGARLYRFHSAYDYQSEAQVSSLGVAGERPRGQFDAKITFRCRRCGARHPLCKSVMSVINEIKKNARLSDTASPVLELPDEAWDENGLEFECPDCHQPHRSTPFYVDRKR